MDSGIMIATLCGIGSGALCLVLPGLIAAGHQGKAAADRAIDSESLLLQTELIEAVSPIEL